jgi:hypothetical protein
MNSPVVATPAVSRFRRVIVAPDMVYALAVRLVGRIFLHCDNNLAFLSRILAWRHFAATAKMGGKEGKPHDRARLRTIARL